MGNWLNRQLRLTDSSPYIKSNDGDESTSEAGDTASALAPALSSETIDEKNGDVSSTSESRPAEETSEASTFEQRCAYKLEVQVLITLNNQTTYRYMLVNQTLLLESFLTRILICRKVLRCSIRSLARALSFSLMPIKFSSCTPCNETKHTKTALNVATRVNPKMVPDILTSQLLRIFFHR